MIKGILMFIPVEKPEKGKERDPFLLPLFDYKE